MWTLWIFGDNVEDRMGPMRFSFFYVLCGIAAGIVHCVVNPGSTLPTVGASGAIAGSWAPTSICSPFPASLSCSRSFSTRSSSSCPR